MVRSINIVLFRILVIFLLPLTVHGMDEVRLQLRWHHQFQFAGYYVAKELGFYQEQGINVDIVQGYSGLVPADEVSSGSIDFAIDNSGLLARRAEGAPIKALAAVFQKDSLRLISLKTSNISRVEHLSGKRVMLQPGYGSLSLLTMLTRHDLINNIKRQTSSHNILDLVNGNTDAFNGYASNEPYLLEQLGIPFSMIDPSEQGVEFYSDVLFTSDRLVKNNPELVVNFTTASLRGWAYAMNYVEEAIDITQRYAPGKDLGHLRFEAIAMQKLILADLIGIGRMNIYRWNKIQQHLINIGMIKSAIDLSDFIFDVNTYQQRWQQNRNWMIAVVLLVLTALLVFAYFFTRNIRLTRSVEKSQDELARAYSMATHDSLTELPNRLLLMDRIEQVLARLDRGIGTPLIGFIDLDNFKSVNDNYGHDIGDALLRMIARKATDVIRPNDTFARIGGDEFIYLAENSSHDEIEELGLRLSNAVSASVKQLNIQVSVTASIGFLLIHSNKNLDATKAMKLADLQMYEVKSKTKNGISFCEYTGEEQ